MKPFSRLAILTTVTALAVLGAVLPAAADDGGYLEVVRLREVLRDIVSELSLVHDLDSQGVVEIRDELARVYRDLDALADRMHYISQDGSVDGDGWQPYAEASINRHPIDASFDRWYKDADVDLQWGAYGELILKVENGGYSAECSIRHAYSGEVQASLRTEADGNIILKVQDEIGSHAFNVAAGGLGPVTVRGRDMYPPDKQTQPIGMNQHDSQHNPVWYASYTELVAGGQLGASPGMEWLISQFDIGDYESYTLEHLGDRLATLPAQSSAAPLAWLEYRRGGKHQELELPDPRFNPAGFVHVINKLYNIVLDGKSYDLVF